MIKLNSLIKQKLPKGILSFLSVIIILLLLELSLTAYRLVKHGVFVREDLIEQRKNSKYHKDVNNEVERRRNHWENSLVLHPLFGYVHNPSRQDTNNYGFKCRYDFGLNNNGYYLKGIDREKSIIIGVFGGSFAHLVVGNAGDYFESRLQSVFHDRNPVVINFSFAGHALPQSAFIFEYFSTMLDIAVFLDGLNELWNYLNNNKAGFPPEYAKASHYQYKISLNALTPERFERTRRIMSLKNRLAQITDFSMLPLAKHSIGMHYLWGHFANKWANEIRMEHHAIKDSYTKPKELFYSISDNEIVEIAASQWRRFHESIHRNSLSLGIKDFHLIQPNPYVPNSKSNLTDVEKQILENDKGRSQFAVVNGYPLLRRELDSLITKGATGLDLSYIYKDVKSQIWADFCHANRDGCIMIIDEIMQLIEAKANN